METRIVKSVSGTNGTASGVEEMSEATLRVLPAYAGMSLIDAAGAVLWEHVGEVMTLEQVARVLYGEELSRTRLSTTRHKVKRVLWDGASRKK